MLWYVPSVPNVFNFSHEDLLNSIVIFCLYFNNNNNNKDIVVSEHTNTGADFRHQTLMKSHCESEF